MGKAKERNKDKLHGKKTLKVDSFFEEIEKEAVKKQVDIVELFSFFGVALTSQGKNHTGRCPWHEDKTPSLSVSRDKGIYNCFGCGESGDAISLVEKMQGVEFREALVWLSEWNNNGHKGEPAAKAWWHKAKGSSDVAQDKAGASLSSPPAGALGPKSSGPPENRDGDPGHPEDIEPQLEAEPLPGNQEKDPASAASTPPSPTKGKEAANREEAFSPGQEAANGEEQAGAEPETQPDEKTKALKNNLRLAIIVEYYQKSLYTSRIATSYLERRGITNKELFSRYYLGYADGSLTSKLSTTQRQELKELGILNQTGREHFAGCITIPLLNEQNHITGFYGRAISETTKLKHRYQQGPHKGLFNHKAAKVYDQIILTEAIIDALSLLQIGIENVIPCYGTNGFTETHLKAFKDNLVKTVIIAFDNDEAGSKATEQLKTRLLAENFKVKTIIPPTTKDWNEELLNGLSKELVLNQIETAGVLGPAKEEKELTVTKLGLSQIFSFPDIRYRLLGVKELFVANLRVNIRCDYADKNEIDNVDLYSARSRSNFATNASARFQLEVKRIDNDLIRILEHLETERDKQLGTGEEEPAELTEEEKALGMSFLTSPDMFKQIIADTETLGYVGEDLNKQLLYIAASSRKLEDPISVIVISQSSAGKSYLIDTIKKLIPPEEVVSMTSLSDQALNYLPAGGLTHKFMVMGEAVHSETVDHQVREMLSAHELSRLVTLKDPKTGELTARTVKTEAVVSLAMSSTRYDINQENASRAFVINSDESVSQTKNIHQSQRKKYSRERYLQKKRLVPQTVTKHLCAQRLLVPRIVINPFGELLDFPDNLMRTRRDHERFIDLIAGVCFLRQYQKEEQTTSDPQTAEEFTYIECDLKDYKVAYNIMTGILPATLSNFPKSAACLYEEVRAYIKKKAEEEGLKPEEVSISQRELREESGFTQRFIKRYMKVLLDYEYLKLGRGGRKGTRNSYQLIADEGIELVDISRIPTPEAVSLKLGGKSGPLG